MEQRDVVIIGGGPAGLSAARRLSELGIAATVLEREQQAGGAPRHCGHLGFGWESHRRIWTGPRFAERLRTDSANLDLRTGHTVLGIDGNVLRVLNQRGISEMAAGKIILATGTRETPRSARLVGGSRPRGVMTTGALQAHVYLQNFKPFERPVIIGSEWVSFSAILTCRHIGVRPVAMIEAKDRISAPRPGGLLARLIYGVPVWTGTRLIAIDGRTGVEAVEIERHGRHARIACDGVIFTGEWAPEAALLVNRPKVTLAGNVHGDLKTSGACWREGRAIAEQVARGQA
ncbi:FAD/NAD(P)-binding oxidoreductase [Aestuariivirga sp.]|uniref:NAD(P)/FAD-dependent oxidoreductase n=1 Tax=Aestuariivirga sp. TaxID=2650926 RepID=UPI0025B84AFE|nr:FAD/NAD(P)-binding oxidoreductase [Aestuariivirga sp.]MCA3555366.1 FAD-dependent oxidoreductase [Aestuariivirga sp.]